MSAVARPLKAATARSSLKREVGATLALGWPIILANVAIYAMTATDFIMLGRLSPRALAAGALGFNLYQPEMVLGHGIVAAPAPIAAAKIGAGESRESLRRATHHSLLSAVAFSTARAIFSAYERPRPTLITGIVAVSFNALANYALVFGKLGMPPLGIIGSGIATTLSQSLMFLILLGASFVEPRLRWLRPFALPWRPARREFVALWRLGLPMGAMIIAEVGVFSAATMAM